jgi:hypothetical protein
MPGERIGKVLCDKILADLAYRQILSCEEGYLHSEKNP